MHHCFETKKAINTFFKCDLNKINTILLKWADRREVVLHVSLCDF